MNCALRWKERNGWESSNATLVWGTKFCGEIGTKMDWTFGSIMRWHSTAWRTTRNEFLKEIKIQSTTSLTKWKYLAGNEIFIPYRLQEWRDGREPQRLCCVLYKVRLILVTGYVYFLLHKNDGGWYICLGSLLSGVCGNHLAKVILWEVCPTFRSTHTPSKCLVFRPSSATQCTLVVCYELLIPAGSSRPWQCLICAPSKYIRDQQSEVLEIATTLDTQYTIHTGTITLNQTQSHIPACTHWLTYK